MARLALALVGGIIGSFIPGIGWSIGFLVGNVIGTILFPPKGPDGPRMSNLDVTSSIYGQFITQGHGTVRVPGNIIWGLKIKEHKHSAGKGGMAGGGGSGNTYTYSWTGAIAVGRGPITDVLRVWADTKLIYDKTGRTPHKQLASKRDFRFRLYKGTETQLADSAIIAKQGVNLTPAHRGMAYLLMDDIQLANYGNRVPAFTFEVAWAGDTANPSHVVTQIVGGDLSVGEDSSVLLPDWDRNRFTTMVIGSPEGFRTYNLTTMAEMKQTPVAGIDFTAACDRDGTIYVRGDGGNSRPLRRFEGDGLVNIDTFGISSSNLSNDQSSFVGAGDMDFVEPVGLPGIDRYLLVTSIFNDIGVIHCDDMRYTWGKDVKILEARSRCCGGAPSTDDANGYVMGFANFGGPSTAAMRIYQINVLYGAVVGANVDTGANIMVQMSVLGSITPANIAANWHEFTSMGQFIFDFSDNTIIFGVKGGPQNGPYESFLCKWNPGTATFKWRTKVASVMVNAFQGHNQSRLEGGSYAYIVSGTIYQIDTVNGLLTTAALPSGTVEAGAQVYDSTRDAVLMMGIVSPSPTAKPVLVLLNRSESGARGLGVIVDDICSQVGLDTSDDIDTSQLTDDVRGYVLNTQMSARNAIEPLGFAFLFDGAEIDDKIRFVKRGQEAALFLTTDDLVRLNEETSQVVNETRTQEVDLPLSVSVIFMDVNRDYQQNTATRTRTSNPYPTMSSRNASTVTVPIVLTFSEAKKMADRALWAAWQERVNHDYKLTWGSVKFDPTDVVEITLANGVVLHDRIIKGDIGADFSMEWNSVSERAVQYTTTVVGDGGGGFIPQEPPTDTASRYFLLDTPYFRDQDAPNNGSSYLHAAGSGYGVDNWNGMILEKSSDGTSFLPVGAFTIPIPWGIVIGAPGDTDEPFEFDTVNTVTVSMVQGEDELSNCTRLECCNGQNAFVILNEQTGVPEIMGFTTVVQNADGSYTLSDLRRGRRGTEVYVGTHSVGETFLLVDPTMIAQISMNITELNIDRFFLGVSNGDLAENGTRKTIQDTGRDLKPWAPVHIAAELSGSDIDLSWVRRTRLSGGMTDGTGTVPLFEDTEAYEVDIYNALGDTVLRTLDSLTTPAATYLAADITTDFGGPITEITVAVYQMSALVGRGFAKKVTVVVS